jgi:hypothetical protein
MTNHEVTTPCIDHGKRGRPGKNNNYAVARHRGKTEFLHRLVYCEAHGLDILEIKGKEIRHICDDTRCINPDHLLIGSRQDNMDDMAKRRRSGRLKLTIEQVHEIRATCQPGNQRKRSVGPFTYRALGRKFGVAHQAIRQVYLGESHKFV